MSNNDIIVAIENLIEERFDEGNYIRQHDDNEILLEDAISEVLDKFDIQYSVENMYIFESPGYDTGVVFIAWVYEGTLDTYPIQWESM
jgi:hypothetical protein